MTGTSTLCCTSSLLIAGMLSACQVAESFEPPQGGLQRMIEQPRYDPFEHSDFFDDGLTMRHPPEDTVPFPRAVTTSVLQSGLVGGEPADDIPLPVTRALLELGRERYEIVCATCHGVAGTGVSPVARNMQLRPPPSLVDDPIADYAPGRLYRVITHGYGFMPSYSMMLEPEERWAIVAYMEALALSRRAHVEELPAGVRERLLGAPR